VFFIYRIPCGYLCSKCKWLSSMEPPPPYRPLINPQPSLNIFYNFYEHYTYPLYYIPSSRRAECRLTRVRRTECRSPLVRQSRVVLYILLGISTSVRTKPVSYQYTAYIRLQQVTAGYRYQLRVRCILIRPYTGGHNSPSIRRHSALFAAYVRLQQVTAGYCYQF
jgi:hypothetical protein